MTTNHANITAGPSKFDLMLALFDRDIYNSRKVEFKVKRKGAKDVTVTVNIYGVSIADSDGDSWRFHGSVQEVIPFAAKDEVLPGLRHFVEGYFRTDTRKGEMHPRR